MFRAFELYYKVSVYGLALLNLFPVQQADRVEHLSTLLSLQRPAIQKRSCEVINVLWRDTLRGVPLSILLLFVLLPYRGSVLTAAEATKLLFHTLNPRHLHSKPYPAADASGRLLSQGSLQSSEPNKSKHEVIGLVTLTYPKPHFFVGSYYKP